MAKIIAHRGASHEAPENTLSAIHRAIELRADYIELDVHLTSDGIPVISHDPHIKSHVSTALPIEALTLAQIKEFDVGHWFHKDFIEERIPTLEEVLNLSRGSTNLMIELKKSGADSLSLVKQTIEVINQAPLQEGKIIIGSFDLEILSYVKQLKPHQPLIGILEDMSYLPLFLKLGIDHFAFDFALLNESVIHQLKNEGMTVWTYTVDDPSHIQALIDHKIDGIITNDPRKARSFASDRK